MLASIGPMLSRRWAGLVVALLALASQLLHFVLADALLVTLLLTVALVPDARGRGPKVKDLLAWYPLAASVLLGLVSVVAILAGLVHVRLWSDGLAPWSWAFMTLAITGVAVVRRGVVRLVSPLALVPLLPALVVVGVQIFRFSLPTQYWSKPAWVATDWVNHAELIQDLRNKGVLDYLVPTSASVDVLHPYPRGLHALLTWLLQAVGSTTTAFDHWSDALMALMVATAVFTALAMIASGVLAGLAADRLRLPTGAVVGSSLVASAVFLFPNWYSVLNWAGFVTTAAAALLLPAFVVIAGMGSRGGSLSFRLVLLLLITAAVFNVWQLLVVPCVVVDAFLMWQWWRRGRRHWPWVAGALIISVASCVTLSLATIRTSGMEIAMVPGPFVTFSVWFTVLATVGSCVVLWFGSRSRRRDHLVLTFVLMVALLLIIGLLLLAYTQGTASDIPYYPAKVLWHAVLLAFPVFVVALVWTWWRIWNSARLDRLVRGHQLYRVVAVGAPTLLLVAYFGGTLTINSPYAIAHISDSGGDQPQVPLAVLMPNVDLGEPGQPVLVWNLHPRGWHIEHPFDDWQASQALRSIGHPIGPDHALLRHDSAETCDWLRQNTTAIRLTGPLRGQDQLLASGCPADVVRPEEWQVITTPAAWWVDNRFTNTGKDAFREA